MEQARADRRGQTENLGWWGEAVDHRVTIRLRGGGQVGGLLLRHSRHEVLLRTERGESLVMKHAIQFATREPRRLPRDPSEGADPLDGLQLQTAAEHAELELEGLRLMVVGEREPEGGRARLMASVLRATESMRESLAALRAAERAAAPEGTVPS